jgi:hypothetical protein
VLRDTPIARAITVVVAPRTAATCRFVPVTMTSTGNRTSSAASSGRRHDVVCLVEAEARRMGLDHLVSATQPAGRLRSSVRYLKNLFEYSICGSIVPSS